MDDYDGDGERGHADGDGEGGDGYSDGGGSGRDGITADGGSDDIEHPPAGEDTPGWHVISAVETLQGEVQ